MTLKIGDEAPDFEAVASDGRRIRLSDFRRRKNVVLYFYPRDFTRICTAEACGFRDLRAERVGGDLEVIGVSIDDDKSHLRFAEANGVSFPLISDTTRTLSTSYGAMTTVRSLVGLMKRLTCVIDKRGIVVGIFVDQLRAAIHVDGVRELVGRLT